jgi:hypothetical protein
MLNWSLESVHFVYEGVRARDNIYIHLYLRHGDLQFVPPSLQDRGGGDSTTGFRVEVDGQGWACVGGCMEGLRPTEPGSRGIDWLC